VYVADHNNRLIRKITPAAVVTTLAGGGTGGSADGTGITASFGLPRGITMDASGNLYVADNSSIRKVSAVGYSISPALPAGLTFDPATGAISGTPLLAKAAGNYTITAYNTGGSCTATVNIAVTGTAVAPPLATLPVISYTSPQKYVIGLTITPLKPANSGGATPPAIYSQVFTFAGSGSIGRNDGNGMAASFYAMQGLSTDIYGNIYVADAGNNIIRRISPAGVVITLAGSGSPGAANGTGPAASFNTPFGLAVDKNSNIYVADAGNYRIRKISPSGVVTILAGSGTPGSDNGTGAAASFNYPQGITVDKSGNVYVADTYNYLIRKITPGGVVTTLAGSGNPGSANGTGTAASFSTIQSLAVDVSGNIYAADAGNYLIRKITPGGVVTTLAGGGPGFADGYGTAAGFSNISAVTVDAGGYIYAADAGNNLVRKISPAGAVTTLAGSGNAGLTNDVGTDAGFNNPQGLAVDNSGNLYVADAYNNIIRKVSVSGYTIDAPLPSGLAFDGNTGIVSGKATVPSVATNYKITAYNGAGAASANVNITVVFPPVVTTSLPVTAFASMGDILPVPVTIDGSLTATDLSRLTLDSAKVTVSANFVKGQDVLAFSNNPPTMGNITGGYNSTTGILSLFSAGGTASLLQWQSALRSITYTNVNNVAPNTANRTISFVLNDGAISSIAANKTVSLVYTPSHNANLSNLTLSPGTLAPAFSSSTTSYTANFSNATSAITLKPVTVSANATLTINGVAVLSGAASPAIPLNAGNNMITTLVTAQDKTTTKAYVASIIRAAIQTITFAQTRAVNYGPDFNPGAISTNSTIPITYTSSNSAVATIVAGKIHILSLGTTTITASQSGSIYYDPAAPVSQTLTINPALLSIAANNQTRIYGGQNPSLTYTISGFVNGDTQSVLTAQPTVSTTATAASTAGTYAITVGGASAVNYSISYAAGTLTVTKASLTITAVNQTKVYGAPNPVLTVNYNGFVNGDTQTVLTAQPTVSTTATTASVAGVYPITVSGAAASNYTIAYIAGTLTISQPPSTNAKLALIHLSSGTLSPVFAAATTNYTASATNATTSITVTPTVVDATATVTVNGTVVSSGTASGAISLAAGPNIISTVVTAQDGITTKTYTVTVTRAPSSNAKLALIRLSSGTLSPVFAAATTSYTASVTNAITSITVTPTVVDASATVTANGTVVSSGTASGSIALAQGANTITVIGTAQDGVTKMTYTVTVTRATGPVPIANNNFTTSLISGPDDGIIVHQGVSPNGDGENDFLNIEGITKYPDNKLMIMNRNGTLVFEANGYNNGSRKFEGHSNKNGKMQLPGTYFYSLEYKVGGVTKRKTGFIILKY
jgi:gliding motility-associated-like protein